MQTKKLGKTILIIAAVSAVIFLCLFVLLPLLLPFLLGALFALGAEPGIRLLQQHTSLRRWQCTGISLTLLFALVVLLLVLLVRAAFGGITSFSAKLPSLLAGLAEPLSQVQGWLSQLTDKVPAALGATLSGWIDSFLQGSSLVVETVYRHLAGGVSQIVAHLPGAMLGTITAVLSAYMFSAAWPDIRQTLKKRLPKRWQTKVQTIWGRSKSALGGWFKAQLTLMAIVFGVVTLGLLLLGADLPLVMGAVTALVDALPVLGAGMILIPWALLAFLQGSVKRGIGLLVLYGIVALARAALEPKLVGKRIGLPPLVTLLAFYVGYRLLGVVGMITFPIGSIVVKQGVELLSLHPGQPTAEATALTPGKAGKNDPTLP